jgi:hypothetical protein
MYTVHTISIVLYFLMVEALYYKPEGCSSSPDEVDFFQLT